MSSQPVLRVERPMPGTTPVPADKWLRVAAYLLDVIPAIILGLVSLIPIVGLIFAGLLLGPYWLLRDIKAASLGKLLLGLRVTNLTGERASVGARILRNLPLIAALHVDPDSQLFSGVPSCRNRSSH